MRKFFVFFMLFFITGSSVVEASSSNAWKEYHKKVFTKCSKISALKNPKQIGSIEPMVIQEIDYGAILLSGKYPQPHMNNATGNFICLFNNKEGTCTCSEVDWLNRT